MYLVVMSFLENSVKPRTPCRESVMLVFSERFRTLHVMSRDLTSSQIVEVRIATTCSTSDAGCVNVVRSTLIAYKISETRSKEIDSRSANLAEVDEFCSLG